MKKFLILLLLALIGFDPADVLAIKNTGTSPSYLPSFSDSDDFSQMLKKRRKKRKKGKKGKKRGNDMTIAAGGGLFLGFPAIEMAKEHKMGYGLDLEADYFVTPQFSVGINTGFYSFKYNYLFSDGKTTIFPFMVKGDYYFIDGPFKPYAGLGFGMFGMSTKYTETYIQPVFNPYSFFEDTVFNVTNEVTNKMTKFGIAPSAGFLLGLSDKLYLHFDTRYTIIFSKEETPTYDFKNRGFLGLNFGVLLSF